MPVPVLEACKKRKRAAKFYGLHTFADPGCPIAPSGPFRDNVLSFLQECTEPEDYNVKGMPVWCTFLVHEKRGFVLPLYTIEESVKRSLQPFCDHCRCAGWSHHFVSKRKYHFIIPMDDVWNKPLNAGVFDLQTHLLHGLIHCNGFGHLLSINGREAGCKYLRGKEIMDLWDRICTNLHARKVAVEDTSKKKLMDLRLLHGVTYGRSWFGRWGYRFCHGSFGVKEQKYSWAVEILSSLDLDKIIQDFQSTDQDKKVKHIIQFYRDLSVTQLVTIRDLLRFVLTLKSCASTKRTSAIEVPAQHSRSRSSARTAALSKPVVKGRCGLKCKRFATVAANLDSRWPIRRLEYTANVIVDALKEKKVANKSSNGGNGSGMIRQEARDAARQHIGDTGLIDHVLKAMNNVIVGGYIVRRAVNPSTRVLEFTIQEVGNDDQVEPEREIVTEPIQAPAVAPGVDVYSDVYYLYSDVLLGYPDSEVVELAVQTILDSKQFVKDWPFRDEADEFLRFICRVMPSLADFQTDLMRGCPPGEYISVPLHATIGDLKAAVQGAMRDTYCIMEGVAITEIDGVEGVEDTEVLFGLLESGSELWLRGCGMDLGTDLKYEAGADNWTVRCKCGTQDDDGERMVACDMCEVWQHTRCNGIDDSEAVPPLFVCSRCCTSFLPPKTEDLFEYDYFGDSLLPPVAEGLIYS
ncbi:hypothetical protein RJ639_028744 [Escallonia herrerae]|uniref:Zinc finger PHD-type domain-containing protein n=1 Tax=Escallonia herrerae TaxID=1293975 RepID=A0AA89BDI3_9ASTE|nr:hypothetical protein RJ639_028744 [Escallonia herrerae]